MSTTKAEYVDASLCYSQVLWQKKQLMDYNIHIDYIPIKCDNTSTINFSKNLIQYSRTKHINIRHHFLRDHIKNGDISLEFVNTNNQLANIFTKPLNEERLNFIKHNLGMIDGSTLS